MLDHSAMKTYRLHARYRLDGIQSIDRVDGRSQRTLSLGKRMNFKITAYVALSIAMLPVANASQTDQNIALNKMLEDNAAASAYARMCDEEPMAEEIKANTMMLLAVSGIAPKNVQLGSAKFSQIMRREFDATKGAASVNCPAKVAEAKARLAETLHIIQATHRQ